MAETLPGTPQHQALLRSVVSFYTDDPRIRAVVLFGSLSRGTWDRFSDLDLDVVLVDGVNIDVLAELERLCDSFAPIGEQAALIVPDGTEAGDIVLASLEQLSIRYHPLATTSPNIVDSLYMLVGHIDDAAAIIAAGMANQRPVAVTPLQLIDRCVRYVVGVDVALQRGHLWGAIEQLHLIRGLVMDVFAMTHGGGRAVPIFQRDADATLQAQLGKLLPQFSFASVQGVLLRCIDLLEHDLSLISDRQVQLGAPQRAVLDHVRQRQMDTRG